MAQKAVDAGQGALQLQLRRMAWLMLFGLLHGYLLWYGDILFTYALAGLLLCWLWRLPAALLFVLGALLVAVPSAMLVLAVPAGQTPTIAAEMLPFWAPSAEDIERELTAYRGDWGQQMPLRFELMSLSLLAFPLQTFWRVGGLMLIGMGLYKIGLLTGAVSPAVCRRLLLVGLLAGVPLVLLGVLRNYQQGWDVHYLAFFGREYNYWGSIAIALAYVAAVVRVCQVGYLPRVRQALAAVGRLALTNYLMQTVICTTLFYGHGLGWFGQLERMPLLLLVVVIWAFQIVFSLLWLRRFAYGPVEWLWRALTYWRFRF
ncbi:DUF418 domain-containing protein [Alkalilimnicola ehrlichii]|uniref:DUF418 domain-containing protein n=2 Tax=Alkalilimnicola ehrlichii TaxID=351052 RepID=A0A3E0WH08_9GAMM|nr:DUF418 domain-containing protein [Alkalilimnicola ehrlichii]RFA32048.1 hypothetical protein CAL65_20640 [Alkalilimnicola ehrlichii]